MSTQPAVEQLQTRFLITDVADADLGALLGIGYPQWTGGPLSYIDSIGSAAFVAACERFAAAHGQRYAPALWLKARAASAQRFHPQLRATLAS